MMSFSEFCAMMRKGVNRVSLQMNSELLRGGLWVNCVGRIYV